MINLALAFIWGIVGVVLIAYHVTTGDTRWRLPFPGNLSAGWAALLICLYNIARWWSQRLIQAEKKALWLARARRGEHNAQNPPPPYGVPNPDFRFSDEPPPPKT
jgi:hypothetical protein